MKTSELIQTVRSYEVWDVPVMAVRRRWLGYRRFQPVEVTVTEAGDGGWLDATVAGPVMRRNGKRARIFRRTGLLFNDGDDQLWPAWLTAITARTTTAAPRAEQPADRAGDRSGQALTT
jgi:hypothetical protein